MSHAHEVEGFAHNEYTWVMVEWFRRHYEDPVHHCPVESRPPGPEPWK
jgi:hypothetical protein